MAAHDPVIPGYEIVEVIGRGGFAVVHRALQQSVDRMVALKVVSVHGQDLMGFASHRAGCGERLGSPVRSR